MHETFHSLLTDPAHWEFELLVGLIETIVIDVLGGFLLWKKLIKPKWERRKQEIINKTIEQEHVLHAWNDHKDDVKDSQ